MLNIPLQAIPNQILSIILNSNFYDLTFNVCNGIMACDVVRNNETLQTGMRVVNGTPILPYTYQQDGNFLFLTTDEQYPDYTQFGITQFLIYYSQDEINGF